MEDTIAKSIDKELINWGTMPPHGPMLLAWAALLCRLQQVDSTKVFEYRHHATKSVHLRCIDYLYKMVEEGFSIDDVGKNVVLTILSRT